MFFSCTTNGADVSFSNRNYKLRSVLRLVLGREELVFAGIFIIAFTTAFASLLSIAWRRCHPPVADSKRLFDII